MTPVPSPRFRISRHRRLAWLGSALACGLSLLGLALCWLNPAIHAPLRPGLDFTGGTQVQVERDCAPCKAVSATEIRQGLSSLNLPSVEGERAPNLSSASVQVLDGGRSLLLRLPALGADQSTALIDDLAARFGPLIKSGTSVNTIGPTLGSRLLQGSLLSLLVSFVGISVYISFRYSGIFAVLALLCLAHDILITCGLFAWLGLLQGIEVDSLFAVSLITIAGYSVNDTVVVYDRIREQRRTLGELPLIDQVDVAVDATLTRSLYTSFTTLLPLVALIFFGGSTLFWFAVALTLGIAVGSWSSIGLAPTLLPVFSKR
ncbi:MULTISPECIES: protein translocase subunit SecF [unclassified Cyanobium]|uniref:protein translocase subunit SecF n=1 Tax=unclassified Cyanobium TaxID=2627006 RepID=UPI0020CD8DAE|nr:MULTISPECIES: protein translocase subunit SecF [unclassified Cyanobium]MCP9858327.1 protein translocase subunit SecF [Cyanobium sp. Cruz-8H5]MCP9865708.1 protein translocase subunit SecF [Cyanobium sp. Cruz-8D1]